METIRNYVESLFASVPPSADARRLKEDMLLNLEEKYNALIAAGKSEAEAVGTVIMGIGSAEDLGAALNEDKSKKSSVKISFRGVDVEDGEDSVHIGWDGVRVKDGSKEGGETVEIDEDGVVIINGKKYERNRFPFEAILWPACIIAYLIMGFLFNLWHPGWMLFVVATVLTILYDAFAKGNAFHAFEGIFWILIAAGYLYAGIVHGLWHPGWIVFPVAGLLQGIVHTLTKYYRNRNESDE